MAFKRSKHELKRIIEEAVSTVCGLPQPGLLFAVDEVEAQGRPPAVLRVWYTLHFFVQGSPFCCQEPGCHLWLFAERRTEIGNCVRLSMGLRQPVKVTFVGASVNIHAGATILEQGTHRSSCNYNGMRLGGGYERHKNVPPR